MHIYQPGVSVSPRRLKRLMIDADFLVGHFASFDGRTLVQCMTPMPADVRCVGITVGEIFDVVTLYLESQEWPEVDAGLPVPIWEVQFRVHYGKETESGALLFESHG